MFIDNLSTFSLYVELLIVSGVLLFLTALTISFNSLLPARGFAVDSSSENSRKNLSAHDQAKLVNAFKLRQKKLSLIRQARFERKKDNLSRAEELLFQASGFDHKDTSVTKELIEILIEQKKHHKARVIVEKLIQIDPRDSHYCDAGDILFAIGKEEDDEELILSSLKYYQNVMEKAIQSRKKGHINGFFLVPTKDHSRAIHGLAQAYMTLDRENEAIIMFENLHRAQEPTKNSAFALIDLYRKNHRWVEIGNLLERLSKRYPLDPDVLITQIEYLFKQEHYEQCIEECKKLDNVEGYQEERLRFAGLSAYFLRQYDIAVTELRKLVSLQPHLAKNHYNLSLACIGLNDYDLAEKHIRKAIDINTNNPKYHFLYGKILVQLKEKKAAQKAFERVLVLDKGHMLAKQELIRLKNNIRLMSSPL